jgi:hypothetical protein
MDAICLREALPAEFSGKDPQRQAGSTLEQLARKELLEKRKTKVPGRGEVVLYRPFGADVRQAKLRPKPPSRRGAHQAPHHPHHPPEVGNREQPSDQPLITPTPSGQEGSEDAEGAGGIPARATTLSIPGLHCEKGSEGNDFGSGWDCSAS